MNSIKNILSRQPLFLFLLPVFFVLHGFNENFHYSLAKESALLTIRYIGVSLLFAFLFRFLTGSFFKGCMIALLIMAINFFFGSFHDFLKEYLANTVFIKYTFLVPFFILLLALLTIFLKRTNKNLFKLTLFLNSLLLLLIFFELITLTSNLNEGKPVSVADLRPRFKPCDSCTTPDIYIIIADEYAGQTSLTEFFSYDNSAFESELKRRGFHVVNNSKSNYNATVYSMASLFSMDYISGLRQNIVNHKDMFSCREYINRNNLLDFLKPLGYKTYNFSPFDFDGKKNFVVTPFFASKKEFFTSQTFTNRFWKNVGYHFVTLKQIERVRKRHLYNNRRIDSMTRIVAASKTTFPKLVYTHLAMPHHPYYYDRTGAELPLDSLTDAQSLNRKAYIDYLIYTNSKLLSLIDHIKTNATNPPIIVLLSDHGFRQFTETKFTYSHFWNLNAVFFPGGDYSGFYDGMTNVNQFRIILNSQFGQNLPLLKDSTSILWEPKQPITNNSLNQQ